MYESVACACSTHEGQKGALEPLKLELQLCESSPRSWELNPGPQQGQSEILTTEPSFQILRRHFKQQEKEMPTSHQLCKFSGVSIVAFSLL